MINQTSKNIAHVDDLNTYKLKGNTVIDKINIKDSLTDRDRLPRVDTNIKDNKYERPLEKSDKPTILDKIDKEDLLDGITPKKKYRNMRDKLAIIKEERDSMYKCAMGDSQITIDSLYRSAFSGGNGDSNNSLTAEDTDKLLKLNNLEATNANKWAINKLNTLGLDINPQDVLKIQNIKGAVDDLAAQEENIEELTELGLIEDKTVLVDESTRNYSKQDIEKIQDDLNNVTDTDIEEVIKQDKEVNIKNLRAVMEKNTDTALGKIDTEVVDSEMTGSGDTTDSECESENTNRPNIEEVKQQIKEIRARLTIETAQKISEKLPLESTELARLAEELIKAEDIMIEEAIDKIDIPKTIENKTIVSSSLHSINLLNANKVIVSDETTDSSLLDIEKIVNSYEENRLDPEIRFGETTKKVENKIKEVLESVEIEVNQLNVDCARALIAQNLEINKESIELMKNSMRPVDLLIGSTTPELLVSMIKEGINPYTCKITNIVNYIENKELPILEDNIAERIVALESSGKIDNVQKDSLVGLYRIINSLGTHKDKIVGYLVNNQLPLTLENIDKAIKYVKPNYKIDSIVDSEVETIVDTRNAKELVSKAVISQSEVNSKIAKIENLDIDRITSNVSNNLYPIIKDLVKKELGKMENLPDRFKEKMEFIKTLRPEVIDLVEKLGLPKTLNTLHSVGKMLEDRHIEAKLLDKNGLLDKRGLLDREDLGQVEKEIEQIEIEVTSLKQQSGLNGDMAGYKSYKQVEELLNTSKQFRDTGEMYSIPFIINGEPKTVNMYVRDREDERSESSDSELRVAITYDTKTMGLVVAHLNIDEKNSKITYSISTERHVDKLDTRVKDLENLIKEIGYSLASAESSDDTIGTNRFLEYLL